MTFYIKAPYHNNGAFLMDLFKLNESYDLTHVVEDSWGIIRKQNPIQKEEDRESYKDRLFWLVNDEIERRILLSGKKRPNYSSENLFTKNKKPVDI